jgi:hypothetical protein
MYFLDAIKCASALVRGWRWCSVRGFIAARTCELTHSADEHLRTLPLRTCASLLSTCAPAHLALKHVRTLARAHLTTPTTSARTTTRPTPLVVVAALRAHERVLAALLSGTLLLFEAGGQVDDHVLTFL